MSTPIIEDVATAPKPGTTVATPREQHPAFLAISSALLLWTTFPPADWSWLAWIALVPFFLLVPSRRPSWLLYGSALLGGFVFWVLSIQWIRLSDESAWLAWLVMAGALAFFWPAFLYVARIGYHRLRLPLMIAAPVSWVALEYVRAYAVTGFPWYYLAHSQHSVLPVIQISDLTGSLGVSFLIALVNAWVVDLATLPLLRPTASGPRLTPRQGIRLATVVIALGATLLYGAFRLGTASFRPGPRVALLQSDLLQRYRDPSNPDSMSAEEILEIYRRLCLRAAALKPQPDLVIWPETSYPYGFVSIDARLSDEELDRQDREIIKEPNFTPEMRRHQSENVNARLREWTSGLGIPMLVGAVTYDHRPGGMNKYNSALLFEPGNATIQASYKMHLVPFGEYVPLIETFPFLLRLTPYHGTHIPSLNHATGPVWLKFGPYKFATAICFEDTVPQVVRRFFHETKDDEDPDAILNMSNDGWFQQSSEHDMHLAVSVFRAIEHRAPLARAANTGVSAIVDGNGRVVDRIEKNKEGVLSGVLPLDNRTGPYSHWGDWLGQTCLAISIGLIPMAYFSPNRRRGRIEEEPTIRPKRPQAGK